MRPEEDDQAFLWDMREAASDISRTVLELSAQEFVETKFTRLAVERLAIILGEAAAKLSEAYRPGPSRAELAENPAPAKQPGPRIR